MPKNCDNKSVGVLLEQDGRWAMIFRKNYPHAWAMIAGHIDDHGSARQAALAEAKEEGSLALTRFVEIPFRRIVDNPCKRGGGTHHEWSLFGVYDFKGEPKASSDARDARWVTHQELLRLAGRTEYFAKKYGIPFEEVGRLTVAIFGTFSEPREDPEWAADPGLEPVWYYMLKKISKV